MKNEQFMSNLKTPDRMVDVILDTDAYNEIDDQFAISYMLANSEKLNVRGICAAPFFNPRSVSPADGMEKSYNEILKLLSLAKKDELKSKVFRGSEKYLESENVPVESVAASFMARTADEYSPENPLYIVAIGAITNVASAILKNERMKENCVIVWLGGHAAHMPRAACEFNMVQDIAAARVVFGCGVPLVQLPCGGVVDIFTTGKYELLHFLKGKSPLCDYLCESVIEEADSYALGKPWTRVIWDVTAVAWLLNENSKFMDDTLIPAPIPEYDETYSEDKTRHQIKYVYRIKRDALFDDLYNKLANLGK